MASKLAGKVAVVTGSSSGLGEAIAVLFASQGASVTLCGRNEDRLRSVLEKLVKANGGDNGRFLIAQGDVKDRNVRKEIIGKTVEKFGRLDILVASAGIIHLNQFIVEATEEIYNDIMDTNLKSVFFLIQEAVPHLEKTKDYCGSNNNVQVNKKSLGEQEAYCQNKSPRLPSLCL